MFAERNRNKDEHHNEKNAACYDSCGLRSIGKKISRIRCVGFLTNEFTYISGLSLLFISIPDSLAFKNISLNFGTTFKMTKKPVMDNKTFTSNISHIVTTLNRLMINNFQKCNVASLRIIRSTALWTSANLSLRRLHV